MPLLLVQAFLNTHDPDTEADLLDDADTARRWFVAAGLLGSKAPIRPAELALARTLRESVRSLLSSGGKTAREAQLEPIRRLARTHHPRLTIDNRGQLAVENPRHDVLADGLFDLLLVIRVAQEDGTWTRLRACSNPDCGWVFYDRSRNQRGSWCDMAVCGNRLKNRRLRARRK